MFIIFVHYSTRPIYDVSMNWFCRLPSVDMFNILPGFLWQPLLNKAEYRNTVNHNVPLLIRNYRRLFSKNSNTTHNYTKLDPFSMNAVYLT